MPLCEFSALLVTVCDTTSDGVSSDESVSSVCSVVVDVEDVDDPVAATTTGVGVSSSCSASGLRPASGDLPPSADMNELDEPLDVLAARSTSGESGGAGQGCGSNEGTGTALFSIEVARTAISTEGARTATSTDGARAAIFSTDNARSTLFSATTSGVGALFSLSERSSRLGIGVDRALFDESSLSLDFCAEAAIARSTLVVSGPRDDTDVCDAADESDDLSQKRVLDGGVFGPDADGAPTPSAAGSTADSTDGARLVEIGRPNDGGRPVEGGAAELDDEVRDGELARIGFEPRVTENRCIFDPTPLPLPLALLSPIMAALGASEWRRSGECSELGSASTVGSVSRRTGNELLGNTFTSDWTSMTASGTGFDIGVRPRVAASSVVISTRPVDCAASEPCLRFKQLANGLDGCVSLGG